MTQVHAINMNGRIVVVKKDFEDETRDVFVKRSWWIAKQVCNQPKKELQQIENESCIWSCITNYGAVYDEQVMQSVRE
jgi:hypothetical protein